ncbi:MAG: heavy metal-associated domain-containing protein, partial [Actinomycetota bacterium]|nr:heavy metal-associated domain-containing protein [Actinomycetota bacterium]
MTTPTAQTETSPTPEEGGTAKQWVPIVLDVSGMTCASCVTRVERALAKVDGVAEARVNLATEAAEVAIEGPVDEEALVGAVRAAGYEASIAIPAADPAAEAAERRGRRATEL